MNPSESFHELEQQLPMPPPKSKFCSRISIIKKNFKDSFGFLRNSPTLQAKSSTILDDQFSSKKNQQVRKFDDLYEELELIGEGAHGVVKKVRSKLDGSINAVKIIRTNDPEIIIAVKNEYLNSSCLHHQNIIKIKDLFIEEVKGKSYYVMEYLNLKSLDHLLRKQKRLTEKEVVPIISQILLAVQYMHKQGISHRDLKPKNIMIDTMNNLKPKIIDFGISKNFISFIFKNGRTSRNSTRMYTCTGTLSYSAPEIFIGEGYNNLVDIWAVGVITYQLLSGILPFSSEYVSETIDQILKTPLDFPQKDWSNTSALAMDFIRRMLNRKIKHRLSASEALLHPFLSQFLNNTPKRTLKMSLSPENSKRFLAMTLTQRDVKDSFSSHKMTLNPKYNEEKLFKIRKLEFDPDPEEGKIDPEFLNKRNSNRFKRKEFFENFQTRIELRSPFKNKSPLNKKLFPSSLQGSKSDI